MFGCSIANSPPICHFRCMYAVRVLCQWQFSFSRCGQRTDLDATYIHLIHHIWSRTPTQTQLCPKNNNKNITRNTKEFVQGLSTLSRGTMEEKLRWTFSLYDINGDGFITRDEMTDIATAVYELMGRSPETAGPDPDRIRDKVDKVFVVSNDR